MSLARLGVYSVIAGVITGLLLVAPIADWLGITLECTGQ